MPPSIDSSASPRRGLGARLKSARGGRVNVYNWLRDQVGVLCREVEEANGGFWLVPRLPGVDPEQRIAWRPGAEPAPSAGGTSAPNGPRVVAVVVGSYRPEKIFQPIVSWPP